MKNIAYIGFGSNLGDSIAMFDIACDALNKIDNVSVLRKSGLYCTKPLDVEGEQPDFINAVIELETNLEAELLLACLQEIETKQGRVRGSLQNMARTLDLDILLFNDEAIQTEHLTLPHPRLHIRAFVLAPLLELLPAGVISGKGTISELLSQVNDQNIQRL